MDITTRQHFLVPWGVQRMVESNFDSVKVGYWYYITTTVQLFTSGPP